MERLAFSVTWDLTPEGKILAQWAGRSVIKSCVKLAYGHAQDMIEGKFEGLPDQETPSVELHGYAWPEVGQQTVVHKMVEFDVVVDMVMDKKVLQRNIVNQMALDKMVLDNKMVVDNTACQAQTAVQQTQQTVPCLRMSLASCGAHCKM